MLRDAVYFIIGFAVGTAFGQILWQWVKHKIHPDKPIT